MLTVFCGKFFRFAHGNEAGAETIRERGGEDETARFHSGDEVNRVAVVMIAETINERTEALLVLEKRRQIVEKNSRLRIIGTSRINFSNHPFEKLLHSSRVMLILLRIARRAR